MRPSLIWQRLAPLGVQATGQCKGQAIKNCGITADECVVLTIEQVRLQRKARWTSKAVSAGKKRQAGEEPIIW